MSTVWSLINTFTFYDIFLLILDTRDVRMFVLDEADELLSRGFQDQVYDIFQDINENVQVSRINQL